MKTLIAMLVLLVVSYADDNKCIVEKPAAVTPARVMVPACHRANPNIQQAIAAEITNQYMPEQGGKPQVEFPCDGLGARIHEIVIETGDGHSGVLELWSAKRRPDGKYDVRGIVYRGNSMLRTASPIPHEQAGGVVDLPEIDKARAAITATVREIVPPTKPGDSFSIRSSGSSRDFHIVVRLVDDEGRVVERRYTGYLGSSTQDAYLGLQIAQTALAPIMSVAPGLATADATDKRFLRSVVQRGGPLLRRTVLLVGDGALRRHGALPGDARGDRRAAHPAHRHQGRQPLADRRA